jgi:hypothetical protein
VRRVAFLLGILVAGCDCSFPLNPSLDISQYAHTAWTVRDGFSLGNIYAIAQTPDGYLWLGTEFCLFRFDGLRSLPWQPLAGQHLPDRNINSLLVTRDALSLVAPEKIHLKYKLEGQNRNWHEVINERQATYTNLSPAQLPLPRDRLEQQWHVERYRRHAGVLHRPGVLSDHAVLRIVRGRFSGNGVDGVPASCPAPAAAVRYLGSAVTGTGTEIDLSVAGSSAYAKPRSGRFRFSVFRKLAG